MERIYFYVMPHGQLWEVRTAGQFDLQMHETQEQAFLAAATAARRRYEAQGVPTGLRIQSVDRSWRQLDLTDDGELLEQPFPL